MAGIKKVIYSRTMKDFDENVTDLETLAPKSFFSYCEKNWLTCKDKWAHLYRQTLPTFGNNTNNRIGIHNQKLKQFIRPPAHLTGAITELINYIQSVEESIQKAKFKDLKSFINTKKADTLHLEIAQV